LSDPGGHVGSVLGSHAPSHIEGQQALHAPPNSTDSDAEGISGTPPAPHLLLLQDNTGGHSLHALGEQYVQHVGHGVSFGSGLLYINSKFFVLEGGLFIFKEIRSPGETGTALSNKGPNIVTN